MIYTAQLLSLNGISETQAAAAARTVADQARRLGTETHLRDDLEALGLIAAPSKALSTSRDNLNRPRSQSRVPTPFEAVETSLDGTATRPCFKGLHDMDVHGKQRLDNARWYCGACAAVTNKRNRDAKKAAKKVAKEPAGEVTPIQRSPELGPDGKWCNCPDTQHVLTPETSETTYVDSAGHRRCKAGRRAQKAALRRRAAA